MRRDVMTMRLSDLIATVRPTDHLDAPRNAETPLSDLWANVFGSIERNHVDIAPEYWGRFAASVAKRQWVPVRLHRVTEGGKDVVYLLNGHHRVWALAKANIETIRWIHA